MKIKPVTAFVCLLTTALWISCDNKKNTIAEDVLSQVDTSFSINIRPYPPKDLDSGAVFKQLVEFAWEEFLALNWKSSFTINGRRDSPDTTWSYASDTASYPELNVWETYAHRTELRPWTNRMLPFDLAPHYSFGSKLVSIGNASFRLFNNLDENNEIGSCELFAHVYPRADTTQANLADQVLYQAKVNRDEYEYIRANYKDTASLHRARTNTKNNIINYKAYYKNATGTCDCPPDSNVICLPCGGAPMPNNRGIYTGAMEVKSAWRELKSFENPKNFFTRKVIYYTRGTGIDNTIYYGNKTYALIGLHIIHKTKNYPSFVFATWEHVGVEQDTMRYILSDVTKSQRPTTPYRNPINAITAASTRYVHNKLPKTSVWQNYRLVGVQARPTNDSTSTNFYLANYVVESDPTLNHFRGNSIDSSDNGKPNLLLNGKLYTMGGCQGCHGAAQFNLGTDFSFLLDNVGKPVQMPDIAEVYKAAKLKRYISAFRRAKEDQIVAQQRK